MPQWDSYDEKLKWLGADKSNKTGFASEEDKEWFQNQQQIINDNNAFEAANEGDTEANEYIMQKYGLFSRLTGWGIPKVNKYKY